jgi:hypothetical protein
MKYTVGTWYRPRTLKIDIVAKNQCQVNLQVCDWSQPFTYFTKRSRQFAAGEKQSLYVQMPITGKGIEITIFEDGMNAADKPKSFTIEKMRLRPLARQMKIIDYSNKYIRHFIPFIEKFCFNAGVLPTYDKRVYTNVPENPVGKMLFSGPVFQIKYVNTIMEKGMAHLTPARIGIEDKLIEIAKSKYQPMTVPGRIAVSTHEFSHLYTNEDMYNEAEADINGCKLYIALGYPIIELHEMYLGMFYQSQTEVNFERYEKVKKFIDDMVKLTIENT